MIFKNIIPNKSIDLFVKNIWVFEQDKNIHTSLPFFADGYPGIIFQQSEKGLTVSPFNKKMPKIFLYGQTIKPISLEIEGSFRIVIFQLYPFVPKTLFNILPNNIHDNCCDIDDLIKNTGVNFEGNPYANESSERIIELIVDVIIWFADRKNRTLDTNIVNAVKDIIQNKGQINIQSVILKAGLNTRTFERRFFNEIGLTAKQFAKIIQFQASMIQLSSKDYEKLTDIVYQNGFADQSHFIRAFKSFTGKTPKHFKSK